MGRKKYPTVCDCCEPPVELQNKDSAANHKTVMKKRAANDEADAAAPSPPPKKLSGLQQTVVAFVEECGNGSLFNYFVNKRTAFYDILDYNLGKYNSQERLAIHDKFINLISEADKKVNCH